MTTIPGGETFEIDLDIRSQDIDSLLDVTSDNVSSPAELTFVKNVFLPLTTPHPLSEWRPVHERFMEDSDHAWLSTEILEAI